MWPNLTEVSVEFFVTQDVPKQPTLDSSPYDQPHTPSLAPPRPGFMTSLHSKQSFESIDTAAEEDEPATAGPSNPEDQTGLSDVEFEGEEEGLSANEQKLGQELRKTVSILMLCRPLSNTIDSSLQGKLRRATSRKVAAERDRGRRLARPESRSTINTYDYPPSITPDSRPSSPYPPPPFLSAADREGSRQSFASTLNLPYKLSTEEEDAVNALAEVTKTGRPDLYRMLQEEIACAAGRVLIAACGPPSREHTPYSTRHATF